MLFVSETLDLPFQYLYHGCNQGRFGVHKVNFVQEGSRHRREEKPARLVAAAAGSVNLHCRLCEKVAADSEGRRQ
jgi:hypothetical protein